jgi:hypothetical protein
MTGCEFECARVRSRLTRVELARLLGYDRKSLGLWVQGVYPVPRAVSLAMLTVERMYPATERGRSIYVAGGVARIRR